MIWKKIKYLIDNIAGKDEEEKQGLVLSRRSFFFTVPALIVAPKLKDIVEFGPSPLVGAYDFVTLRHEIGNITYSLFDVETTGHQGTFAYLEAKDLKNVIDDVLKAHDRALWSPDMVVCSPKEAKLIEDQIAIRRISRRSFRKVKHSGDDYA